MSQKEFKESIKALKSGIYIMDNECYDAFKSSYYVSDVYKKPDETKIKNIRSNIDSMFIILEDMNACINPKILRHVR